jgi:hypothetical protein
MVLLGSIRMALGPTVQNLHSNSVVVAYYIRGGLQQIGSPIVDPIGTNFEQAHYSVIPTIARTLHPWSSPSLVPWRPIVAATLGTSHSMGATLQLDNKSITLDWIW